IPGLLGAMKGKRNINVPMSTLMYNMVIALLPALVFAAAMALTYNIVTEPDPVQESGLIEMGSFSMGAETQFSGGLAEPEGSATLAEPSGAQPLGADVSAADSAAEPGADAEAVAETEAEAR